MKQLLRRGRNNKYVLTREVKILGRYKGPPLGPSLTNRIYYRTKYMKQLLRRGHNNKYVLTREVKILGRKITKSLQRRGRNIWYGRL